jgi:alpha-tubulin suppressor-like RCC1 family protein
MSGRYLGGWEQAGLFNPLVAPTLQYNLFSWGINNGGVLGLGNITNYSSPKQVGSLTNWLVLASCYGNSRIASYAIKSDGTLWSWGQNAQGQLGLNNTTYYSSPKQVGALTNWLTVSAGYAYAMAIKTDGSLWAIGGKNQFGNLGSGNTTNYSSPKQVGALTNWSKVITGLSYVFAIKTDGTLWSWGRNQAGCLGLGNTTYYSSPKQVGALTNWLQISASTYQAYAVKTNGTLWTWGWYYHNQLPLNVGTTSYSSPTQVGALTNWKTTAAGYFGGSATKTDGTLWTWGYNNYGQLGLGNTTNYSSPVQIGALSNWSSVIGRYNSQNAIKTDGTLWTWGQNNYGQLGLGNTTYYSSPKQVGSSTTWNTLSIGCSYFVLALE